MATEKRLIDVLKHRLESHIATAIYKGINNIPTSYDSCNPTEYLKGYERGAIETANIVLGMIPVDAVEVVHARWESVQNGKGCCSNCHRLDSIDSLATHCRYCGAKMDGGNEDGC
jgi:hypothetical protein